MQAETDEDSDADCNVARQELSHLAHELRGPLAPMQCAIDVMKLDPTISAQSAEMLVILERQLRSLLQTIDDFSNQAIVDRPEKELEAPTQAPAIETPKVRRRQEVLVVDDTRVASYTLQKLLESLGQNVRTASNGLSAMVAIRQKMPEIVFSDIGMIGMDGYELARQIRSLPSGNSVRIIAVTGYAAATEKLQAIEAGFDDHIVKPVTYATLVRILNEASRQREDDVSG